jgi:tryptophan-rich sensory protein
LVIAVLWILILITILKFWPINKTAALLLVPYIIWVSVAAYLNYSLWRLNP